MDRLRALRLRLLAQVPLLAAHEDTSLLEASDIWRVRVARWPGKVLELSLISDPIVHIDVAGFVDGEEDLRQGVTFAIVQAILDEFDMRLAIGERGEIVDRWIQSPSLRWPPESRALKRTTSHEHAADIWRCEPASSRFLH